MAVQIRKYRFWEPLMLREAIVELEKAIALGAASVSTPSPGGSVTWTSRDNYEAILRDLYAAYDAKTDGITRQAAISHIRIVPRRGL